MISQQINNHDFFKGLKLGEYIYTFILLSIAPNISFSAETAPNSIGYLTSNPPTAFTLLGSNPELIERPATPNDLAVYILTSTKNLTSIPRNFAVEIAPAWLCTGHKITFDDYIDHKLRSTLWQTWSISYAMSFGTGDSLDSTMAALGTKASFFRGDVDTNFKGFSKNLTKLRTLLSKKDSIILSREDSCLDVHGGSLDFIDSCRDQVLTAFDKEQKELQSSIKQLGDSLEIRRLGLKLDCSAAAAVISPPGGWNELQTKAGGWITMGLDWKTWGIVGVGQFLCNFSDSTKIAFEGGFKGYYDKSELPLSCSLEALYRRSLFPDIRANDRFRLVFGVKYKIGDNAAITVCAGKELGSTIDQPLLSLGVTLGKGITLDVPKL